MVYAIVGFAAGLICGVVLMCIMNVATSKSDERLKDLISEALRKD